MKTSSAANGRLARACLLQRRRSGAQRGGPIARDMSAMLSASPAAEPIR